MTCNSLAEEYDLANMTTRELQSLKKAIQDELDARQTNEADNIPSAVEISDIGSFTLQEVIDTCKAITDRQEQLNHFDSFEVPVGTWTVGKNLYSGTYSVAASNPKDSGYIYLTLSEYNNRVFNLSAEDTGCPFRHFVLSDGDTIEIPYNTLVFTPGSFGVSFEGANGNGTRVDVSQYNESELKQIYHLFIDALANQKDLPKIVVPAGIWVVGRDIPVGTYDITAHITAEHGNFSFESDAISLYGYGSDIEKAQQITLTEGSVVVTDGCVAELTISADEVFFGK